MLLIITLLIIYSTIPATKTQNSEPYEMKIVAIENPFIDKGILKTFGYNFTRYNRTTTAANLNFELSKDLNENLRLVIKAHKKMGNQYIFTGLQIERDLCDMIRRRFLVYYKNTNLTPCPLKKGGYYMNNVVPSSRGYPPHLPNGEFSLEAEVLHNIKRISKTVVYVSLKTNPSYKWF